MARVTQAEVVNDSGRELRENGQNRKTENPNAPLYMKIDTSRSSQ